jgi:triosephosphate isomerase
MRQLIAGNWKMNGLLAEAMTLAKTVAAGARDLPCDLLVCPPATVIRPVAGVLAGTPVAVGGQDCHGTASGAHTGDTAAAMLRDAGATWVILGHSERRCDHAETDAQVAAKVAAAVAAGLVPIVCVGETEAERLAGRQDAVVGGQLAGSLPRDFAGVVAYEPVWAIGTGRTPTEADVTAMHGFIRATLLHHLGEAGRGVRILYGGSVKPSNAGLLLALPEVGGALVGGASLVGADFLAIARAAATV